MTDLSVLSPSATGLAASAVTPARLSSDGQSAVNPLRVGLQQDRNPAPCVMVIFGVSGDLTSRKLMPSLYDLAVRVPLPPGFSIVGVSRRDWTDDEFRDEMRDAVKSSATAPVTDDAWNSFARGLFYVKGNFDEPDTYQELKKRLEVVDRERGANGNKLFYLATPPSFYEHIVRFLGEADLAQRQEIYSDPTEGWTRIVVEKPFGHDLAS